MESEKYEPFARGDAYGAMGRGATSPKEKLLLAAAAVTLAPLRLVIGVGILFLYYLICRCLTLFSAPNKEEGEQEDYAHMVGWRRAVIVHSGRLFSRALLFVMGFYRIPCEYRNGGMDLGGESERPGVIVSNHVSYLDILYHMSASFPSFVAKVDALFE